MSHVMHLHTTDPTETGRRKVKKGNNQSFILVFQCPDPLTWKISFHSPLLGMHSKPPWAEWSLPLLCCGLHLIKSSSVFKCLTWCLYSECSTQSVDELMKYQEAGSYKLCEKEQSMWNKPREVNKCEWLFFTVLSSHISHLLLPFLLTELFILLFEHM